MSFTVNRATCQAYMYLWRHDTPVVISDIDGTITKSDALGHVLNMIGRDWTHAGVAKLYSDILTNGYNIMYLTSRSVGQADTTRAYLAGVLAGWLPAAARAHHPVARPHHGCAAARDLPTQAARVQDVDAARHPRPLSAPTTTPSTRASATG